MRGLLMRSRREGLSIRGELVRGEEPSNSGRGERRVVEKLFVGGEDRKSRGILGRCLTEGETLLTTAGESGRSVFCARSRSKPASDALRLTRGLLLSSPIPLSMSLEAVLRISAAMTRSRAALSPMALAALVRSLPTSSDRLG